jgi:hypothetical protein
MSAPVRRVAFQRAAVGDLRKLSADGESRVLPIILRREPTPVGEPRRMNGPSASAASFEGRAARGHLIKNKSTYRPARMKAR